MTDEIDEPILDEEKIEELRSLLGDGPDGVDGLVDTFVDRIPEVLDGLRQAAEARDFQTLSEHAHKVKGESATLGAQRLSSQAKQLEIEAREEEVSDPEQAVEALIDTYEATEKAFEEQNVA